MQRAVISVLGLLFRQESNATYEPQVDDEGGHPVSSKAFLRSAVEVVTEWSGFESQCEQSFEGVRDGDGDEFLCSMLPPGAGGGRK